MSLKKVGKNLVENQIKTLSVAGASKAVEETADHHYRMGNGFLSERNYSISYYCYYISIREYAKTFVGKKLKTDLNPDEALEYLAKKKDFGLSVENLKIIKEISEKILDRQDVERKDCMFIKGLVVRIRKGL